MFVGSQAETKKGTFSTIERMLSKKGAHYDFREVVPNSFLFSCGVGQN